LQDELLAWSIKLKEQEKELNRRRKEIGETVVSVRR
jgi:hypothetical protein